MVDWVLFGDDDRRRRGDWNRLRGSNRSRGRTRFGLFELGGRRGNVLDWLFDDDRSWGRDRDRESRGWCWRAKRRLANDGDLRLLLQGRCLRGVRLLDGGEGRRRWTLGCFILTNFLGDGGGESAGYGSGAVNGVLGDSLIGILKCDSEANTRDMTRGTYRFTQD